MPVPLLSLPSARLGLLAGILLLSGCASDAFTLEADLPGDFKFTGDARYVASQGCATDIRARSEHRVFETAGNGERPRRVSFQVPMSDDSGGCHRALQDISIQLDGSSDPSFSNADNANADIALARLSIRDSLATNEQPMPTKGVRIFDGQCRWETPNGQAGRALVCRASDAHGDWLEGPPGGVLQRSDLGGRIVRLAIGLAPSIPATADGR
ncbi:hypothetical protein JVX91_01315 [Pseudomonas sp. PDNC002]|uniref:hypothetical protein n=1 Tax=Pseudomonas sp. PDNC002 TaxID=2811422 RepID=UPI0019638039|nr:hypothetical protein [Pseudomonas sp. PDNC002]QRY79783.1 hypothetical protein JVX91_01315 [Pseudomonas sp. PDNC002]